MVTERVLSRLQALIEPLVQSSDAFLIDLVLRGNQGSRVLEVFVDTDEGVSTDRCARISRSISTLLDRENIIVGRYSLVVSSPGLDRPLKYRRQYRRHIGRLLSVRYSSQSMMRDVDGELQAVSDEWIVLKKSPQEALRIPFESIAEAKVKPSW